MTNAGQPRAATSARSEFEIIFTTHYERVLAILLRLTGDRATAEELANEVFWKLSNQPLSVQLGANVGGWLYKTATRAGIDSLRAAARRKRYERAAGAQPPSEASAFTGPLDHVLSAEDCNRVRAVLSSMKPAQTQLLLMRAGGFSYKEIAEALGVAATGVGTLLNRAEAEFRKRYLQLTGEKDDL